MIQNIELFNYIFAPLLVMWIVYITRKIITIDKKVMIIYKLVGIIDFDKVPKRQNINELIKTLEV